MVNPEPSRRMTYSIAGAVLVAPYYQGRRGHPVGFGARHLRQQYADLLTVIPTDDAGVLNDIDVQEDLDAQGLAYSRDQLSRN